MIEIVGVERLAQDAQTASKPMSDVLRTSVIRRRELKVA